MMNHPLHRLGLMKTAIDILRSFEVRYLHGKSDAILPGLYKYLSP